MSTNEKPTHAIVDERGNAVFTGTGERCLMEQKPDGMYPYGKGFKIVAISKVNTTQDGNTTSAVSLERQARTTRAVEDLLAKFGTSWVPEKTVVPQGTRITEDGDGRFIESRIEHESRPWLHEAAEAVAVQVQKENRLDVPVLLRDLRMLNDGRIVRVVENGKSTYEVARLVPDGDGLPMIEKGKVLAGGAIPLERQAWPQLVSFLTDTLGYSAKYLGEKVSPAERALQFNTAVVRWAKSEFEDRQRWQVEGKNGKDPSDFDKIINIRTRNGTGPRGAYAFVSEGYAGYNADRICMDIANATRDMGVKGSVIYNPNTTLIKAHGGWHAQHVVDFGAGDVFRVGFQIESGDARNSGGNGFLVIERNKCRNFIILSTERIKSFSIRHVGKDFAIKLQSGIAELTKQAEQLLEIFAEDWGIAAKKEYAEVIDVESATHSEDPLTETMHQVVSMTGLDREVNRDVAVEALLRGYALEPGPTVSDLVNAVTRAHQLVPVELVPAFERAGGRLLQEVG